MKWLCLVLPIIYLPLHAAYFADNYPKFVDIDNPTLMSNLSSKNPQLLKGPVTIKYSTFTKEMRVTTYERHSDIGTINLAGRCHHKDGTISYDAYVGWPHPSRLWGWVLIEVDSPGSESAKAFMESERKKRFIDFEKLYQKQIEAQKKDTQ